MAIPIVVADISHVLRMVFEKGFVRFWFVPDGPLVHGVTNCDKKKRKITGMRIFLSGDLEPFVWGFPARHKGLPPWLDGFIFQGNYHLEMDDDLGSPLASELTT